MRVSIPDIRAGQCGFTLLEIIVTIIISSVLAVIIAQVVANQTARSYVPLQIIDENMALKAVMEDITSEYRRLRAASVGQPLVTLETWIGDGSRWNGSTIVGGVGNVGGIPIQADVTCIGFDTTSGVQNSTKATCESTDDILKVTLAVQNTQHRLTALFAR